MKWLLTALTVVGISLASTGARADEADIRATYKDFAAAQNARDLHKIGALLLDSPRFLWVSDGQSVWGREATLARMASFQEAPVASNRTSPRRWPWRLTRTPASSTCRSNSSLAQARTRTACASSSPCSASGLISLP